MATWGPSKKREQTRSLPPARENRPSKASSASGGSSRSSGSGGSTPPRVTRARYSKSADDTGGRRRLRQDASGEFKRAIAGREHEFYGLLLIVGGIILAAAVYFDVAGILGDGVDWLVGAVAGLAGHDRAHGRALASSEGLFWFIDHTVFRWRDRLGTDGSDSVDLVTFKLTFVQML